MTASSDRTRARPKTTQHRSISTLAFDWVYTLLVFLLTIGIYMDGWSHASFGPDQSVLSEYHMLFYASLMALGLWLFGTAFLNRREGLDGLDALPAGYKLSALGLVIFGITGVFDLGGHALFGFEVDNEALYSPTHIGLFAGWALLSLGPARAALKRQRLVEGARTWRREFLEFLPALIAYSSFFNVLSFISMNTFGTSLGAMLSENHASNTYHGQLLGIMSIIIQTAVTTGALAWLIARFKRLPTGTFTVFFTLHALYGSIIELNLDLIPVFILVGILFDVLYKMLKPGVLKSRASQLRFHGFNVLGAFVFWAMFYGFVFVTGYGGGVWYTPYIWMGSVTQALSIALLISLLATSGVTADSSQPAQA